MIVCGNTAGQGGDVWVKDSATLGNNCVGTPAGADALAYPNDFAEDTATKDLIVSDTGHGRVVLFAQDGSNPRQLGGATSPFSTPYGVLSDADGNILVSDPAQNAVFAFDPNGTQLSKITSCSGDPLSGFTGPWRTALAPGTSFHPPSGSPHGTVYVVNTDNAGGANNRVVICDASWNYLTSFAPAGGFGTAPTGIALDQAGRIYVADPNGGVVWVFSAFDGVNPPTVLKAIDTNTIDALNYPFGLAVDANGRLLIADAGAQAMWVLSKYEDGLKLLNVAIGTSSMFSCGDDSSPNAADPIPADAPNLLRCPNNITLDSTGRLLIADSYNNRVVRFNHPLMTTTIIDTPATVAPGAPITVKVVVQAAFGTFGKVIPQVTPSDPSLVTTDPPTITPDGSGLTTGSGGTACVSATDPTMVFAGQSPVQVFTVTFQSSGISGPLSFTAYANAIDCATGLAVSSPDGSSTSDPIALSNTAGSISTTATATETGGGSAAGANGWFLTPPVITITATGTPDLPDSIEVVTQKSQNTPTGAGTPCGSIAGAIVTSDATHLYCTFTITDEKQTDVWYRSKVTTTGLTEPWANATTQVPNELQVKYDAAPPRIGFTLSPLPVGLGNWNKGDVTVTATAADDGAGACGPASSPTADTASCGGTGQPQFDPAPVTVSGEGLNLSSPLLTVYDKAGRSTQRAATVNIDRTAPVIQPFVAATSLSPAPNGAGWNHTNVTLTFTAKDNLSGFATGGNTLSQLLTTEGANQTTAAGAGSFTDLAGNATKDSDSVTATFSIDKTPPVVTPSYSKVLPASGWFNATTPLPITLTFTASDPLNSSNGTAGSGIPAGGTTQTVTINAQGIQALTSPQPFSDVAGNTASGSATVQVDTVLPTISAPTLVLPVGAVLNILGFYDLTALPGVGVAVNVTAADPGGAGASGVQQVCYNLGSGATCQAAPAGVFTLTVLNAGTTTGTFWTIDNAGNQSLPSQPFTVKITRLTANNLNLATTVNTPANGTVTATGSGAITFSLVAGSAVNGTVTSFNGTPGAFTFTPTGNFAGNGSFKFNATDGLGTSQGTVTIVIGTADAAPVAHNGSAPAINEDSAPVTIPVLGTAFVTDADTPLAGLSLSAVGTPNNGGTATISGGSIIYKPAANFNGTETFTFQAYDGELLSNTGTITVVVNSVNDPPTITKGPDQTVNEDSGARTVANWASNIGTVESGQTLTITVTNDNNALFLATGQPALTAAGTLSFTPAANANGTANVTITLKDSGGTANGGSDTTVTTFVITVTPVNDAPTFALIANPNLTVKQNAGAQTIANFATGMSAGPADESSQTLTFTTTNTNTGLFTVQPSIAANGTLTFTPSATATGTATVTIALQDNGGTANGGVDTTSKTFVIAVTTPNTPPVCTTAYADPGALWPPNHKFVTIGIKGVTDPDGNTVTLTITKIWQDEPTQGLGDGDTPIDGQILSNGTVAQVRAERSGLGDGRVYQIFFTASDGQGGTCPGSVTVGVPHDQGGATAVDSGVRYDSLVAGGPPVAGTPPNSAPIAKNDTANVFKGESVNILVLTNDTDADHDTLTVTKTTKPAHGTVSINANGTILYTPSSNFTGTDVFTYTVSDGHGGTATATVTVTVKAHSNGDGCDGNNHDGHHEHNGDGNDHGDHESRGGDDHRDGDNHHDDGDRS